VQDGSITDTGYNIYRSTSPQEGYRLIASDVAAKKYTDASTAFDPDEEYYYYVTAVNPGGESTYHSAIATLKRK
jgi:fibronectin type 3 domain-containing protein